MCRSSHARQQPPQTGAIRSQQAMRPLPRDPYRPRAATPDPANFGLQPCKALLIMMKQERMASPQRTGCGPPVTVRGVDGARQWRQAPEPAIFGLPLLLPIPVPLDTSCPLPSPVLSLSSSCSFLCLYSLSFPPILVLPIKKSCPLFPLPWTWRPYYVRLCTAVLGLIDKALKIRRLPGCDVHPGWHDRRRMQFKDRSRTKSIN
jgi:hypothetical protein